MMRTEHRFGKAALAYADRYHWRVFPLRPKAKEPLIKDWPVKATRDPRQITDWWSRWPLANIALCCGQGSGVVVVDVDPRSGGRETWTELVDIHGAFDTLEALSGSGGSHYFFKTPTLSLAKGKLGPGVDLQGERSYLVLSPSIHPCGDPYEWISEGLAPVEIPDWLLERWPKTDLSPAGHHQEFRPHQGTPLSDDTQSRLTVFLANCGLNLQRDGRYRGQCPFPHQSSGDCDCPSSFYASPVTGRWTCFCLDHPKTGQHRYAGGGAPPLLALAGIEDHRPVNGGHRRHRRRYLRTVEVSF